MKKLYLHSFQTPLGLIRTAATSKGLAVVALPGASKRRFDEKIRRLFPDYKMLPGGVINRQAQQQITAYLEGRLKKFTLPLDIRAGGFHKKVLQRVSKIPYGKTATYGQIAKSIGHPNAYRAVGVANARNNLPIVIPCHRVVAATGLGGYGGGLALKKKLLRLEEAI
jgi:methylated-DNA-[protein]-cysteine S-methyltransferase